jgi:hypothetical protein
MVRFGKYHGLLVVAWKGTALQWKQHEQVWPGAFDNMRWYQYPIEMFCFSGALFVGVMEAWVATGVMYFVLLALAIRKFPICLFTLSEIK